MPAPIKKWFQGDTTIWVVIILLLLISVLSVYSATGTLAYRWKQGDTSSYILRHGAFLLAAVAGIFIFMHVHYRNYAKFATILFGGSVILLLLTLLFGVTENDAVRRLYLFGFTIQTSDLAKIALMIFVARELAIKQEKLDDLRHTVLPLFLKIGMVCALILPANLSTAFLIFCSGISLMFIGQVPLKHMFVLCSGAVLMLLLFITLSLGVEKAGVHTSITGRAVTWVHRFSSFEGNSELTTVQLSSESENERQLAENFQAEQAKIAVGTGGILGKGPGQSTQRNFLPHPYSDFIYAIIIEEYGLLGGGVVLFLYLILFHRAAVIVRRSERTFPAYLAIGLTLNMVYQAMIHMAVGVGVIPVTGQPLPLVSMGGTSVIFAGISMGMLLGISREIKKQEEESQLAAQAQKENPAETTQDININPATV